MAMRSHQVLDDLKKSRMVDDEPWNGALVKRKLVFAMELKHNRSMVAEILMVTTNRIVKQSSAQTELQGLPRWGCDI